MKAPMNEAEMALAQIADGPADPTVWANMDEYARSMVQRARRAVIKLGFKPWWPKWQAIGDDSVDFDSAMAMEYGACCRCGGKLSLLGMCPDTTCRFSDHKQWCPSGWLGHSENEQKYVGGCRCGRGRIVLNGEEANEG